ncbi:hypothetical protein [Proteus penneri]|uniref:hypothetical protein n=1 Tax=Proteus penneri TaxID=102862 RepID=UPI00288AA30F|nr:hypothetical protein [Proteus penneri]
MTVSTELSHEEYVGNGVTTDFDFRFRIFESRHLIVVVADNEGNETTLKNGTDYTIVGAGSYHGGKVVLNKPLARGWKILLERDLPVVQETDLRNQGKFFAEVHEDAFDYLTMLIQKALGTFSLSLRKPTYLSNYYDAKGNRIANLASPKLGADAVNKDYVDNSIKDIDSKTLRVKDKPINALPNTEQRANKILAFDDNGQPITVLPESGSASDVLLELAKPSGTSMIGAGEFTLDVLLNRKQSIFDGSEFTENGFEFESFNNYIADNQFIGFIGTTFSSYGSINKITNNKIKLVNDDINSSSLDIDTISYINPKWVGGFYPQMTKIESMSFMGAADNKNEAGLTILQGGAFSINNCTAANCDIGLLIKDAWITTVNKFVTSGSIKQDNGTSMAYNNCWALGNKNHAGAFNFNGLKYSNINSCATDNSINGGYLFENCQGVTVNSCGCESPNVITPNTGQAITLKGYNNVVINGFTCIPNKNPSIALITVGGNNNCTINHFDSNFNIPYDVDVYVYGDNSYIKIENYISYKNRIPIIQIKKDCNSRVLLITKENKYIYTKPIINSGNNIHSVEKLNDNGVESLTSDLLDMNSIQQNIKYTKKGSSILVFGDIKITSSISNGENANIILNNLKYKSINESMFSLNNQTGINDEIFASIKGSSIFLYKKVGGKYNLLTNKDITIDTTISMSIIYFFNSLF